ncbi:MAG: KH domain-containing protein, partial [Desulfosalsimonadaceae bacterium]|nr:KH domain-containing protein [Desulfosalsimonadaceae bacterium]
LVGTKKALIRVFVPDLSNKQLQSEIFDGAQAPALKDNTTPDAGEPARNDVSALVDEAFGQVKTPVPDKKPSPAPKKPKPIAAKHSPRSSRPLQDKIKPFPEKPETEKPVKEKPAVAMPDLKKIEENEQPEQQSPVPVNEASSVDPIVEPKNTEAAAAVALSLAQKILGTMAIDAELSVDNSSNLCRINVKVSEPGILIGKKGQTLDAIQYLVDKVVNKQCGKGNHVVFDVEGYVESRKTELTDLASRLASKAMKTGKPSTMTRMNAHDRRIVHVSLKSNPSVRTQSVGDGYYRKLIIFPKKKTSKQSAKDTQKE